MASRMKKETATITAAAQRQDKDNHFFYSQK
jgi:hypothetical protein